MNQAFSKEIIAHFVDDTSLYRIEPLGAGLINQTFLVSSQCDKFVLQRINHHVFTQPINVIDNSLSISEHLNHLGEGYPFDVMMPHANVNGNFATIVNNEVWRALTYVANCTSPDTINDEHQAQLAANTFSHFSMALAGLSVDKIKPIIEKFHDVDFRFSQLSDAIINAQPERLKIAHSLIDCYKSQLFFIDQVRDAIAILPQRVTHNDTKISNLLFDVTTNKPKAVIDLDTCMIGYLMHDFGDMVRTCCSSLAEDDVNIDTMVFKESIFEALLTGYLSGLNDTVDNNERQSLLMGAKLMPLMIGCRFLTDFLNNDIYFSTAREKHNLDRALNQFRLYELASEYVDSLKSSQLVVA